MTIEQFKKALLTAQADIVANEKYYSELDAATGGDGDHGTAIVAAMAALVKADGNDFKTLLGAMVERLENDVSGSTSTLYGSWFEGMRDAVDAGVTTMDAPAYAAMFVAGLEELEFATKARVGDKTLMDALIPAVEALSANAAQGEMPMLIAAANAARTGSNATADMQAKFGRARNLGERSKGAIDAGSASCATFFEAFTK